MEFTLICKQIMYYLLETSVSTGKPLCHSRESGNANSISREFPGSREFIFT
jgi:hypothetical protein